MYERSVALRLLKRLLKDTSADFRDGQWKAIDALVNRRERLLVVQRTGWGKSAVYFVATRMLRDSGLGATLIVSPLLALMRNQIEACERMGIRALTINSTNESDWPVLQSKMLNDEADLLLISPERLANDEFMENVLLPVAERIGLLVVDEAHCISDWGHDFRPDYRRLVNVLQRMPSNMPIIGTTATANDRVIEDARQQLGDLRIQRGPLMRESLQLQTLRLRTQAERLAWLKEHMDEFPGTGIIYVLTKRDAEQVSVWLNRQGVNVRAYYSGVVHEENQDSISYREDLEGRLNRNELKALVATSALGMGYDKPDLGFVVHYQAPGSIIAYYQQVGRAGRSIEKAVGVLLCGVEDEVIHEHFRRTAFPGERQVNDVLHALENEDGMTLRELERSINLRSGQIDQVLKVLSVDNPAPIVKEGSKWRRTAVPYRRNTERINRLAAQKEAEWRELQSYINERACLMRFLGDALDDPDAKDCGKCAHCTVNYVIDTSVSKKTVTEATRFLQRAETPLICKKRVAKNAFLRHGWSGNIPLELRAEEGKVLSKWGDAGWGDVVAADKSDGGFRDELVVAMAEMIQERWQPDPYPTWVTCVPSSRHPTLVPRFASRLARELSLPFEEAVEKIRNNAAQKEQQNSFYQCRNLDGAFKINSDVRKGVVLLVDDIVDSTWTLTVIAALLRMSGCTKVLPCALASSSPGG